MAKTGPLHQEHGRPAVDFDSAWSRIKALSSQFTTNEAYYLSSAYQEADVRADFINKFFSYLGWDVIHEFEKDPYRQEVRIEKSDRRTQGRADYAFSLTPSFQRVRFLVEAKRPQLDIVTAENCFQAIRYSWPLELPITILTDFRSLSIVDSRFKPSIDSAKTRVFKTWYCSQLHDKAEFEKIYWLLSREAIAQDSIARFAEAQLPTVGVATRQYQLFPGEIRDFDETFLSQLDSWRFQLAKMIKDANPYLNSTELTEIVQRTIDRLIFIRFLEAKGIEPDPIITAFGTSQRSAWKDFIRQSRRLDATYNGIVFKSHPVLDSPDLDLDNVRFQSICDEITDDHSPYEFSSIPVEVLGRIYERFLGSIVSSTDDSVRIEEKDDVRKAGGVYYTPGYIVDFMVDNALRSFVSNATVEEILRLRIIDTSCGSGSFLIAVFDYLMKAILAQYRLDPNKQRRGRVEDRDGELHLTMRLKRNILTKCIFGVDIDPQAIEVAQLSLYLKLMEDETISSARQQQIEMGAALLPSLGRNVVEGNSLITLDSEIFSADKLKAVKSIDFSVTFAKVFDEGGFDIVIGNPPYIKEYTNRTAFAEVKSSPYYEGKMDIWYMFAARALDWLKPDRGILSFIATNNWTTNAGARKFRTRLVEVARIQSFIDFSDFKVFRDAAIQTMILTARRSVKSKSYSMEVRRLTSKRPNLADAQAMLERIEKHGIEYLSPKIRRDADVSSTLTFSNDRIGGLLTRIEAKGTFRLDGNKEITQGIVPNPDVVTGRSLSLLPQRRRKCLGLSVGDGVFVVRNDKFSDPSAAERAMLRPLIEPGDVDRYTVRGSSDRQIIYSVRNRTRDDIPPARILKHLKCYKEIMQERRETQNGRLEFYHLHWPRSERFFRSGPKILSVRKCSVPTFTYTEEEAFVMMAFNVIVTNRLNLKYLTALLNSDLIKFWLRHRGKMQGNNFQIDGGPLTELPILEPKQGDQKRIGALVDRVVQHRAELLAESASSSIERLERLLAETEERIQREINNLYCLSDDETKLLSASVEYFQDDF